MKSVILWHIKAKQKLIHAHYSSHLLKVYFHFMFSFLFLQDSHKPQFYLKKYFQTLDCSLTRTEITYKQLTFDEWSVCNQVI